MVLSLLVTEPVFFCCFAPHFLHLQLHLWQANMPINWLNKFSPCNALSAKPSNTNPVLCLEYNVHRGECCWSCWLCQSWAMSVRRLWCGAGCKGRCRNKGCSWYGGPDSFIWGGERKDDTLNTWNAEFLIYPGVTKSRKMFTHNHHFSLMVISESWLMSCPQHLSLHRATRWH